MTGFLPIGGMGSAGGGGFTLGPPQNVFTGADRAAAESARDTYFTANPSNLAEYNADTSLNIILQYATSGEEEAQYQVRNSGGTAWLNNESVRAVAGRDGADGMGIPITNVPADRVPMLSDDRSEFVDSGIRRLSNGELLMPGDTGFEADSLRIGDISTIHEANSFLRLSNSQFPDVRFDLIDARSRPSEASNRPRQFFLTEAQNDFTIQGVDTETITTSPLTVNYTATLSAQTNEFKFRTAGAMTNVRVTVSYSTGNQSVIKYLPSKAVVLDGTGGYNFTSGDNTVSFPDSPFRQFTGDAITVLVEADSINFLGNNSGFPYLVVGLQRGEFRDLAYLSDINALPEPIIRSFDIPAVVDKTPSAPFTLSGTQIFTFEVENPERATNIQIRQGASSIATLTVADLRAGTVQADINPINLTQAGNDVVFTLRMEDSDGILLSRQLRIRVPEAHENAYYDVRTTNDFTTADVNGMTSVDVTSSGTSFIIDESYPIDEFFGILVPSNRDLVRVTSALGDILPGLTRTADVRTIGSTSYNLYTDQNNSGFAGSIHYAAVTQ